MDMKDQKSLGEIESGDPKPLLDHFAELQADRPIPYQLFWNQKQLGNQTFWLALGLWAP